MCLHIFHGPVKAHWTGPPGSALHLFRCSWRSALLVAASRGSPLRG